MNPLAHAKIGCLTMWLNTIIKCYNDLLGIFCQALFHVYNCDIKASFIVMTIMFFRDLRTELKKKKSDKF